MNSKAGVKNSKLKVYIQVITGCDHENHVQKAESDIVKFSRIANR